MARHLEDVLGDAALVFTVNLDVEGVGDGPEDPFLECDVAARPAENHVSDQGENGNSTDDEQDSFTRYLHRFPHIWVGRREEGSPLWRSLGEEPSSDSAFDLLADDESLDEAHTSLLSGDDAMTAVFDVVTTAEARAQHHAHHILAVLVSLTIRLDLLAIAGEQLFDGGVGHIDIGEIDVDAVLRSLDLAGLAERLSIAFDRVVAVTERLAHRKPPGREVPVQAELRGTFRLILLFPRAEATKVR
ncbi:MAG: hypothetical protein BWY75_01210 [bacterium ADurb.Bin425]|nr:MAG: hypothetical protein BWY75_01210 [bacterium ADurb.Bin425]